MIGLTISPQRQSVSQPTNRPKPPKAFDAVQELDAALDETRAEREQRRKDKGIKPLAEMLEYLERQASKPDAPTDIQDQILWLDTRENAEALTEAIRNLDVKGDVLKRASNLAGLWRGYQEGLYAIPQTGYEGSSFEDWAAFVLDGLVGRQYINDLTLIVTRIFVPLSSEIHFDDQQQPITVERLINTYGMIGKLKAISELYPTASPDKRKDLLNLVVHAKTKAEVLEQKKIEKGISEKDGEQSGIMFPPPLRLSQPDGRVSLTFSDLTDAQSDFLLLLVKKYIQD